MARLYADATADGRVVLTHNRRHFEKVHQTTSAHAGIVSATRNDGNIEGLANRIDVALAANPNLASQHIRVNKSS
jgi:hypothetical protein